MAKSTDFLTPQTESKITAGVERMESRIDAGLTPTEALQKTAEEESWGPDVIRLVGRAYNKGMHNFQRKSASDVFGKYATFELSDPESVIENMYSVKGDAGPQEKAAGCDAFYASGYNPFAARAAKLAYDEYLTTIEKSAEEDANFITSNKVESDRDQVIQNAFTNRNRLMKRAEILRQAEYEAELTFEKAAERLIKHFRLAENAGKFAEFESACSGIDKSAGVIDYIYAAAKLDRFNEKRADDSTLGDATQFSQQLSDVRSATLAVDQVKVARDKLAETNARIEHFRGVIKNPDGEKEAGIFNVANSAMRAIGSSEDLSGTKTISPSNVAYHYDPDHQLELDKIRAQTNLAEMMNDDEIISGYDPAVVLRRFNEITQLSPEIASQPLALRAVLRRHLRADAEPFEAQELAKLEQQLASQKPKLIEQKPVG